MLKPSQFNPNEAWILFRLNDAPIPQSGMATLMFCASLMRQAAIFWATSWFQFIRMHIIGYATRRLLASGKSEANDFPDQVFVSAELTSSEFAEFITEIGAEMVVANLRKLSPFVSEAKIEYRAQIDRGRL